MNPGQLPPCCITPSCLLLEPHALIMLPVACHAKRVYASSSRCRFGWGLVSGSAMFPAKPAHCRSPSWTTDGAGLTAQNPCACLPQQLPLPAAAPFPPVSPDLNSQFPNATTGRPSTPPPRLQTWWRPGGCPHLGSPDRPSLVAWWCRR